MLELSPYSPLFNPLYVFVTISLVFKIFDFLLFKGQPQNVPNGNEVYHFLRLNWCLIMPQLFFFVSVYFVPVKFDYFYFKVKPYNFRVYTNFYNLLALSSCLIFFFITAYLIPTIFYIFFKRIWCNFVFIILWKLHC